MQLLGLAFGGIYIGLDSLKAISPARSQNRVLRTSEPFFFGLERKSLAGM